MLIDAVAAFLEKEGFEFVDNGFWYLKGHDDDSFGIRICEDAEEPNAIYISPANHVYEYPDMAMYFECEVSDLFVVSNLLIYLTQLVFLCKSSVRLASLCTSKTLTPS